MGLGTSLLLIAVGAILRFAVSVSSHGVNIHTVGVILMIVGIVAFVISLGWIMSSAGRNGYARRPGDVPPSVPDAEPRY